jgi:hypothetical protein
MKPSRNSRGRDRLATGLHAALVLAVLFYLVPVIAYMNTFGWVRGSSHEQWGQFGDFIGGFLNPLYALLAFIAVLVSLSLQRSDFKEELRYLKDSSHKEDIYRIISTVYEEIDKVLDIRFGVTQELSMRIMAHEALRQKNMSLKVAPYLDFLTYAKDPTQFIAAHYLRLKYLVEELRRLLSAYEKLVGEAPKPVVEFFARKTAGLIQMFKDMGDFDPETIDFFEKRGVSQ